MQCTQILRCWYDLAEINMFFLHGGTITFGLISSQSFWRITYLAHYSHNIFCALKDARSSCKPAIFMGSGFLVDASLEILRGGCTHVMHGRSRMTVDTRIPAMPGRSTSGFHRPGRHRLHPARSAVRCRASRMKGDMLVRGVAGSRATRPKPGKRTKNIGLYLRYLLRAL